MLKHTLTLLLTLTLLMGCGHKGTSSDAVEFDEAVPAVTGYEAPEPDIYVRATGEGNRVYFQIANHLIDNLFVAPESFAIGASRDSLHYSRDDSVITRFNGQLVPRGSSVAGEMIVLAEENVVGYRLYFHSNQAQPGYWWCVVQPKEDIEPEPTPLP